MSLISEDDVKTAMSEALPSILNGLKQAMTTRIESQARQIMADIVNDAVRKWASEEVVPEVIRTLTENKDGIIAVAVPSGELLASLLAESLQTALKKKLENPRDRKKIFDALFI